METGRDTSTQERIAMEGFTVDLEGRLRKHRCAAPFAQYLCSFPAKRVWERSAIDCVTNECEQLHTEVFRAESLEHVANRAVVFLHYAESGRGARR